MVHCVGLLALRTVVPVLSSAAACCWFYWLCVLVRSTASVINEYYILYITLHVVTKYRQQQCYLRLGTAVADRFGREVVVHNFCRKPDNVPVFQFLFGNFVSVLDRKYSLYVSAGFVFYLESSVLAYLIQRNNSMKWNFTACDMTRLWYQQAIK